MNCPSVVVPTPEAMRELGESIGRVCRGGDVLILSGDLAAGKTTLTQGIGRGLGIDERITSPTFVISREHPNPGDGPDLVHVDAYRLGSSWELDDLDLQSRLASSVVVVEWGAGLAEDLSPSRLVVDLAENSDGTRSARLTGVGERWRGVDVAGVSL